MIWIVFVLALPATILHSFFANIFKCPACYLYEENGDGLKNYYTLVYYVQHDKGWHFSGMNYPYGENIIYTDNQPILAFALKWIDTYITDMDRHVVGTLNMLLLISIYLAVIISYVLLRRWGIGRWWALGSSLCIIMLSPQLLRMLAHYALGYVMFLPLLFLLIDLVIRDQRRRWVWSLLTAIWIVIMSLTHMYFFLISLVILSSFILFWWWYHRREKQFVQSVIPWLAGVIVLPALLLISLKSGTDHITDRPEEPWGLDYFFTNFESTFISGIPPIDKVWPELLEKEKPDIEKSAYTGLMGLIMLPALIFFLFKKEDDDFMNRHVKTYLAVSVLVWCVAAGAIYQMGFKFIWDMIPPLKQFRSLGRFGIAFYYLYMLSCSYLLWRIYLLLAQKGLARIGKYILTIAFVIWAFESWLFMKSISAPVFRHNKTLSSAKDDYIPLLDAAGKKPSDFQAILQLPLVAIGNETMGIARGFWVFSEGVHASIETGLPMIDYAMSRTSVSQGLDILELISTPYYEKKRAVHFDNRPILLLCDEESMIPAEKKWIDKAEKIGSYKSMTLYSLPVEAFTKTDIPVLPVTVEDKCNGWFDGFDERASELRMSGTGAVIIKQEPVSIWKYTDTSNISRNWQVTFWSHIDNVKGSMPYPRMVETDPGGKELLNRGWHRDEIDWSEAYGEWLQVTFPITTQGIGNTYELTVENTHTVIDNLMIIPEGDTCIITTPEMILYNNIPIPR